MEELFQHYIVTSTLSPSFNKRQWNIITIEPPKLFQTNQKKIHQFLIKSGVQKKNLLQKFKRNHATIYNWYMLATRDRVEIQPYIYQLISKNSISIPNNFPSKANFAHRKLKIKDDSNHKWLSQQIQELNHPQSLVINDEFDGHQLYLSTFDACKGEYYIPYDYIKHMKSEKKRINYNVHIRSNHKRCTTNLSGKQNLLKRFNQWKKTEQKTSLLTFQNVLNDQNLNSEKGLQLLLKKKGCLKLVLVNHQRKPINYYLRPLGSSIIKF